MVSLSTFLEAEADEYPLLQRNLLFRWKFLTVFEGDRTIVRFSIHFFEVKILFLASKN